MIAYGFSSLEGDSVDSLDWLQTHLCHSLLEFLLPSVGFGVLVVLELVV